MPDDPSASPPPPHGSVALGKDGAATGAAPTASLSAGAPGRAAAALQGLAAPAKSLGICCSRRQ